jgi:murein DD-endopeptidase MepM/ murein hydrolase activator NlpD
LTLTIFIHKHRVQRPPKEASWSQILGGLSALYQRSEIGFGQASGAAVLSLDQAIGFAPAPSTGWSRRIADKVETIDWVPDLGANIGSLAWFRGVATCAALCLTAWALSPGFEPIPGTTPATMPPKAWDESRAQSILPLAWGGDTGKHMAPTDAVVPLTDVPERPSIDLTVTLGDGDGFARALERAGVASAEAGRIADMASGATDVSAISAGTPIVLTLGRRADRNMARPLDHLSVRARLDLKLEFARVGGSMQMTRIPIAIDHTPLRAIGAVGDSLYRSARAAGIPGGAIETLIKTLAVKVGLDNIGSDAQFDVIVEQDRAATGEVEHGKLLYIGLTRGDRTTRMIEWTIDGRTEWYDAAGVGQTRPGFTMPITGARMTSGFGMRFHPILGYSRFHQGTDFAAVYGTPIHAVTDGLVTFAGWHGGHGNFVQLSHSGGLGTGYGHMSRIAVAPGGRVSQGQIIGYVGSTGLSTGPHCHFETYRNGTPVNPRTVNFTATSLLSGSALEAFRNRISRYLTVRIGGGAVQMASAPESGGAPRSALR